MAIGFATWYAGLAAALTATLLGGLAAVWFFIPPRFSLAVNDVSQVVGLVTYGMVSLTFVAFGQVMNRARRRAEALAQGLRATEERLTLAQQASQIGAFDWNLETGVKTWSPELYDIYGIRPEEFGDTRGRGSVISTRMIEAKWCVPSSSHGQAGARKTGSFASSDRTARFAGWWAGGGGSAGIARGNPHGLPV